MWDQEARFGPKRRFNQYHIWKALYSLSRRKLGRKRLSEIVGVGEGSVRSIVSILLQENLISIRPSGMFITPQGKKHLEEISLRSVHIPDNPLIPGINNTGFLVKGKGSRVGSGLELRDIAVRHGAMGVTSIIQKKGRLTLAPDFDIEDAYPEVAALLCELFPGMKRRDAIIVASALSPEEAEEGGFFAALFLVNS